MNGVFVDSADLGILSSDIQNVTLVYENPLKLRNIDISRISVAIGC